MAGETDEFRNAGVRGAEEEWRRSLEFVPHVAKAKGKAAAGANMMVSGNINQVMDDMYGTLNLLNGNPSAAEAMRIHSETLMITDAAITSRDVGWGVGNALAAEKRFLSLARQDAEADSIASRIAGSPDLQRAEAAKRVEIDGRTDVLTQGKVGRGLLTDQQTPANAKPPEAEKVEAAPRKEQQRRNTGLAGKLFGLDS